MGRLKGMTARAAHFDLVGGGWHTASTRLTPSVLFIEYRKGNCLLILMISPDLIVREIVED